jgi:hypothetical protein
MGRGKGEKETTMGYRDRAGGHAMGGLGQARRIRFRNDRVAVESFGGWSECQRVADNDNNTATATNSGDNSLTLAEVARFGDNNDCNNGTATNSVDDAVTLALAASSGDDGLNRFEATATDGQVDIQP